MSPGRRVVSSFKSRAPIDYREESDEDLMSSDILEVPRLAATAAPETVLQKNRE